MAKQSMIARNNKRKKLVEKHRAKRLELKKMIKSSTDYNVIEEAQKELAGLCRDSNPIRCNNICMQCGRPRGVYRKFGLCKICLRQQLMTGNVPGGRKSSW